MITKKLQVGDTIYTIGRLGNIYKYKLEEVRKQGKKTIEIKTNISISGFRIELSTAVMTLEEAKTISRVKKILNQDRTIRDAHLSIRRAKKCIQDEQARDITAEVEEAAKYL